MNEHSTIMLDATPALAVCRWALRQGTPKDIGEAACAALAQSPEWTDRVLASEHRNAFWSQPDITHALTISESTEFAERDNYDVPRWFWPSTICAMAAIWALAGIGIYTVWGWVFW